MTWWLKSLGVAFMVALPMSAGADPILKFDDPTAPGGTVSYAGTGGAAIGTNILFQSIQGLDTPANADVTLTCVGCVLNFQTGPNISEGTLGGLPWLFAGGGNITIVGSIPTLGIGPGTTLLAGSFSGVSVEAAASSSFGQFTGAGFDTKHPLLATFYGLAASFQFANTAIQASITENGNTGSFSGTVVNADLNNMGATPPTQVPYPGTALLLGACLVGASLIRRARA
jgi:hypothetical protein